MHPILLISYIFPLPLHHPPKKILKQKQNNKNLRTSLLLPLSILFIWLCGSWSQVCCTLCPISVTANHGNHSLTGLLQGFCFITVTGPTPKLLDIPQLTQSWKLGGYLSTSPVPSHSIVDYKLVRC